VFLLTGTRGRLDDLADLDEDELEELYASQGASFTLGQGKIERIAQSIPEVEFTTTSSGDTIVQAQVDVEER
jgi:hypothetical protein